MPQRLCDGFVNLAVILPLNRGMSKLAKKEKSLIPGDAEAMAARIKATGAVT